MTRLAVYNSDLQLAEVVNDAWCGKTYFQANAGDFSRRTWISFQTPWRQIPRNVS